MTPILRILYVIVAVALFGSCNQTDTNQEMVVEENLVIKCGAEQWEGDKFLDSKGVYKLSNSSGRSTDEVRTGNYAVKLVKEKQYGMTISLKDVKPDDYFYVTAWRKGDGYVCASDDDPEGFYKATNIIVETDSLGWQKLSLEFYIPNDYRKDSLKILLANFGTEPVYFDDLTIVKTKNRIFPSYEDNATLNIYIEEDAFNKLKLKRNNALNEGLLFTEDDDWIKAIIFYKDQVLDTRIRLKGDRLDHLQGRKWSYRIKIKGNDVWKGMKTFSIQTPEARNFLHEWFFHLALDKEDLLSTRYGFVPVTINGESLGIYAWEEHFEKQLIESRRRREGPILKLSDEGYWQYDKLNVKKQLDYQVPYYDASVILPFKTNNILIDSMQYKQFQMGRDLYFQYKYAKGMASDIFDLNSVAKYYSMIDATNAYHTLHFFNQRFYYNPVLGKLEPILFDSFTSEGIFDYNGKNIIPEKYEEVTNSTHLKLFADPAFKRLYFKYLDEYSSQSYWEELYNKYKTTIDSLNQLLGKEFKDYHFDIQTVYEIAKEAKLAGDKLKKLDEKGDLFSKFKDRNLSEDKSYTGKADAEILPFFIKSFTQNKNSCRVVNYTTDTIKILGFGNSGNYRTENLETPVLLAPLNSDNTYRIDVRYKSESTTYVFVEIRGEDVAIAINPWEEPSEISANHDLLHSFSLEKLENYGIKIKADTLWFSGKIQLSEPVVIPGNWIVYFEKGTSVDFTNGATFLSYSPVLVKGTEKEIVTFNTSDGSGKGFNVFQTKAKSVIEYATFQGLTNFQIDGWLTTAAVCFYEADVSLKNVEFSKNINCDDALNIIRSNFTIENCSFSDTFADAFDSDFSRGEVISTNFYSPGNDGLDFSGSQIVLLDCVVQNAADKGISCGEGSTVTIRNCTVEGGNIGVASKDNSEVIIENSTIRNVINGLVVFCKKPEYGPATISTNNLNVRKYLNLHRVEEGSNLNFNNREIFGQEKNLAKRFY